MEQRTITSKNNIMFDGQKYKFHPTENCPPFATGIKVYVSGVHEVGVYTFRRLLCYNEPKISDDTFIGYADIVFSVNGR